MATRKKPDELSNAALKRVLKKTAVAVKADNLGRGVPMTVSENGELVEIHPDGTRRVLKKNLPQTVRITQTHATLD